MKIIIKSLILGTATVMAFSVKVAGQCSDYIYYPEKMQIGWTPGSFNEVINLDAATLTDQAKFPRTGAMDGKSDNKEITAPVDGVITLPLRNYNPSDKTYVPSGHNYDVKFVRCVFAPDHYGSAYTKLEEYGEFPAGNGNACTKNDNTCLIGGTYEKLGFIELSRKAVDLCGSVQLDNLYGVEKIQWSYSSTSWKRGVICEVRYGGEGNEWRSQRILPSDANNYTTFSEQGYEFEEVLGLTDGSSRETAVSIRFRPFDCDTITFAHEKDLIGADRSKNYYYKEYGKTPLQVVRIHQVKVWSVFTGSELAEKITNGTGIVHVAGEGNFVIKKEGTDLCTSEECMMEVYTIDGKLIKQSKGTKTNISDLKKGLYVIKAILSNGVVKNMKIAL